MKTLFSVVDDLKTLLKVVEELKAEILFLLVALLTRASWFSVIPIRDKGSYWLTQSIPGGVVAQHGIESESGHRLIS